MNVQPGFVMRVALLCLAVVPFASAADDSAAPNFLEDGLQPFLDITSGVQSRFELKGELQVSIDDKPQTITVRLARFDDQAFDLELAHSDYAVEIRRRAQTTTLLLPRHKVAYTGRGPVNDDQESLAPRGIPGRIISRFSELAPVVQTLSLMTKDTVGGLALFFADDLKVVADSTTGKWMLTEDSPLQFPAPGCVVYRSGSTTVKLSLQSDCSSPQESLAGIETFPVSRSELERTLVRGLHRATEILKPGPALRNPEQSLRKTDNGELRWVDGQRVAILHGSPEQIGKAHGELLKDESLRCIESVLYSFGTAHVIRTGRWFRSDLEEAYARLSPHIPERHKRETRALALSLNLPAETVEVLNVFPELFHCSGFAVFDSATIDGKLYHGRVLDYMTTIGLQDAATTFIVSPDGCIPFANVGYGGFIGSVSGMNTKSISLGEMGGGGEGNWDGVPMATLMRRALEECSTLDEVMKLWVDSPRTCEYYYVFADGKTNQAVGVAALPDSIEFIHPGESHERLGKGIKDAVVLSAGSRLEKLRQRVTEKHGRIDAQTGRWLMSRPVAMQSNLHNVLFVPQDGDFYVANASHSKPAAETPYVKLNLFTLLNSVRSPERQAAAAR